MTEMNEPTDLVKATRYCGDISIFILFSPTLMRAMCSSGRLTDDLRWTSEIHLGVISTGKAATLDMSMGEGLEIAFDLIARAALDGGFGDKPHVFRKADRTPEGKWLITPWPKGTILN